MTDALLLSERQKIHEALTITKGEHTPSIRITRPIERFDSNEVYLRQQNKD